MTQTAKTQKQVKIIARCQFKQSGYIVYKVKSSNGHDTYQTTIVNGKATGCTCPAMKPCYHMTQLEAKEQQRSEAKMQQVVEVLFPEKVQAAREAVQIAEQLAALLEKINAELPDDPWQAPANSDAEKRSTAPLHARPFSLLR